MLTGATDARAADWVIAGVGGYHLTVGSLVPDVFDAYARVFHPALRGASGEEVEVLWAEVAEANARVMHPAAEWGSLTGSWQSNGQRGVWDQPPSTGDLPEALATRLAGVLSNHTRHAQLCSFAVWDGHGHSRILFGFSSGTPEDTRRRARDSAEAEIAAGRQLMRSAPNVVLPMREMRLLTGPLDDLAEFYEPHRSRPSLWWPDDRAWCVATDIDLMSTYVGGNAACIAALMAHPLLEALAVPIDQSLTWEADTLNPRPEPPPG